MAYLPLLLGPTHPCCAPCFPNQRSGLDTWSRMLHRCRTVRRRRFCVSWWVAHVYTLPHCRFSQELWDTPIGTHVLQMRASNLHCEHRFRKTYYASSLLQRIVTVRLLLVKLFKCLGTKNDILRCIHRGQKLLGGCQTFTSPTLHENVLLTLKIEAIALSLSETYSFVQWSIFSRFSQEL